MKRGTMRAVFVLSLAGLGLSACKTRGRDADRDGAEVLQTKGGGVGLESCLAIRGNGARIFAHFGALGRYHEFYPPAGALAGGSSGSITSFLYESMMLNPLVRDCGGRECTPEETRHRLSFLLKSVLSYSKGFFDSDEIKALRYVFDLYGEIKSKTFDREDFKELAVKSPDEAWDRIEALLSVAELRPLVSGEVFKLLRESENKRFHLKEIQKALESFGKFQANDSSIFLFPSFFNWDVFAQRIGRLGNFYAGYGLYYPKESMQEILGTCAKPLVGRTPDELAQIPFSPGISCEQRLLELISAYRSRLAKDKAGPFRIDEVPGENQKVLISTAVLKEGAEKNFREAYAQYVKGTPPEWKPDFSGVRVGYFTSADTAKNLEDDPEAFTGIRKNRLAPLLDRSWREIIRASPAEPSLSGAQILSDGSISVGGWIDLNPVLALNAIGCQHTLLVARPVINAAQGFAPDIARRLGASEKDVGDFFEKDVNRQPLSVFSKSLDAANGIWCARWDDPKQTDIKGVVAAGYNAPFHTNDPFWKDVPVPTPSIVELKGRESCIN